MPVGRRIRRFIGNLFVPTLSQNPSRQSIVSIPDSPPSAKQQVKIEPEHPPAHHGAGAILNTGARMVFNVTREASDVFPPLKSVLGGLTELLNNYDQAVANKERILRIKPRLESLASLVKSPPNDSDAKEIQRRVDLKQKLTSALDVLQPMLARGKISRFFFNSEDAGAISDVVQDIGDAITDYQTSLQQDIYSIAIEAADLALLNMLPHAKEAAYNAGNRQKCLRGTRVSVLQLVEDWVAGGEDQRIYWLNGVAGIGKSTISQSFAEFAFAEGRLGASFFCSRDSGDRSDIKLIFPSIAYQLACHFPEFRQQLLPTIRADPGIGYASLSVQLQSLIIEPLRASGLSTVIAIDALDECRDQQTVSTVLSLLSAQVKRIPAVKFFIASRPESNLRVGFRLPALKRLTEVLFLHEVEKTLVEHDIEIYLRHHLTKITVGRSDLELSAAPFPTQQDTLALAQKCGGLFIFASTALYFISSPAHDPRERLRIVVDSTDTSPYGSQTGIDKLYSRILEEAYLNVHVDDMEVFRSFRLVLGCILFLSNPMPCQDLATLLQMEPTQIKLTLRSLHSVIIVPDSPNESIRIYHASFFDYLTDATRCLDSRFYINPAVLHRDISAHCLKLMIKNLKPNICGIPRYSMNDRIENLALLRHERVGGALEYACRFWTKHLSKATAEDAPTVLFPLLRTLTEHHLLCWIEVLSLMNNLSVSIPLLREVQRWLVEVNLQDKGNVFALFYECERLVLEFFDVIQSSALHVYHSALPFSPSLSPLRQAYRASSPTEVQVLTGLDARWDECIRTIEMDSGSSNILSVTFSPTGNLIAAARLDGFIDVLDSVTGLRLDQFYRGQPAPPPPQLSYMDTTDITGDLAEFSIDDTLLAAVSDFGVISVWCISTGEIVHELGQQSGQGRSRQSLAFSPDGKFVAGTAGAQIRMWDLQGGECVGVLEGLSKVFTSVRWSSNGAFLVSIAEDGAIKMWDPKTKASTKTIVDHSYAQAMALSLDSNMIATCSDEGSIIVYDLRKGEPIATFEGDDNILSVSFSSKGTQVAYTSEARVGVWDFTSDVAGVSREPTLFQGHSETVNSVSFSPDGTSLVSGSKDCAVKLWQVASRESRGVPDPYTRPSRIIHTRFSPDGSRAVSISGSGIVRLWDTSTGACTDEFMHVGLQGPAAISLNNTLLAIGADDSTLRIFPANRKAQSGTPAHVLFSFAYSGRLTNAAFSPNSNKVAFTLRYDMIGVWDFMKGDYVATVASPETWGLCSRVFFDSTGSVVTSEFKVDNAVRRWKICDPDQQASDFKLESLLDEQLQRPNESLSHPAPFYADGKWIYDKKGRAVTWLPKECRLLDWPGNAEDSSHWHDQKLVLGSGSGRVTVLDFSNFPVNSNAVIVENM